MNIEKKSKIQALALKAWLKANKKGTCEIITGLGKTFLSLNALYTMPKDGKVHLFLAETTSRKRDLENDIEKYNEIFERNVHSDYTIKFACYQEVYKWKNQEFGLVIADEIHESLSPAYSKFYFNNSYDAIIGLSATIKKSIVYEVKGKTVTKGQFLNEIAPICYSYGLDQGQIDGTARKLNIYVLYHILDDKDKYIEAGNKKRRFYQTEKAAYDYVDKQFKKSYYIREEGLKSAMLRIWSTKRSNLLYKLKSKITIVKKILEILTTKSIVFGNSIDSLLEVTKNTVSSRNTEEKNNNIIDKFEKGDIKTIASFKKLQQGANLKSLDNCIIMSYYSTEGKFIQEIGRLRENGKVGDVFIIVTLGTKEVDWFAKMTENATEFNYIYCGNIDDLIKKYERNRNRGN